VAFHGNEPIAICPFFDVHTADIHYVYSFQRSYFTAWQRDLAELDPRLAPFAVWAGRAVNVLRHLARVSGVRTDRFTIAASPLGYRGSIATAALADDQRRRAIRLLVRTLRARAEADDVPVWFLRVSAEERELTSELDAAGFARVFALSEPFIAHAQDGLDGYRSRFRAEGRRKINVEMKKVQRAGVTFEVTRDVTGLEVELTRLHEAMNGKYGSEHFSYPPGYWSLLSRQLGKHAEFMLAWQRNKLVGFVLQLHKGRDLWAYRAGLQRGVDHIRFLYFSLAYYEPIRRSAELGTERYWLGPGAWATKHRRGALGCPLFNAFYFPNHRARAVLLPYLRLFGRITQRELAFLGQPHSHLKAAC
jgi:predicted N-acyltransferase